MVMLLTASTIAAPPSSSADSTARLKLKPSPLRPNCRASEHIVQWKGIFQPPALTIDAPLIKALAELAAHKSLRAGLRKFHIFCDAFSIPEAERLPASFSTLHWFALWASADPETLGEHIINDAPTELVSVAVTKRYLRPSERAWHISHKAGHHRSQKTTLNGYTGH
jgi:hypothetical protein